MRKLLLSLIAATAICSCNQKEKNNTPNFTTYFEKSGGKETPTYPEVISYYEKLANAFPQIHLQTVGETDAGFPLHVITFNPDQEFDFKKIRQHKTVLLILNGIHPGESDGIDATMMLYRDLAEGKIKAPKDVVLATIPLYNIGGALNRNKHSRANQNGPEEYGFRGNAENYDLNRDFIKNDSKNSRAFAAIYHLVQPDVFIDNHVSDGADYQYVLTHLFTQHNKLGGKLGSYLHNELMPALVDSLEQKNWPITPYVNVFNQVPEVGFSQFMDYPRYSTGYTTLWNTLGMMVETHMLKPYKTRVEGTYELMKSMINITEKDHETIKNLRQEEFQYFDTNPSYTLQWQIDSTKVDTLSFKGFEGHFEPSKITGADRLKYDRTKPFTKPVAYYDYIKPLKAVSVPSAYVIPQGWWKIIERLGWNNIEMHPLEKDSTITVETYTIKDFDTRKTPFEGHYLHSNTSVEKSTKTITFRKGDIIIPVHQAGLRYLIETLEPEATDSFFNWNFFDTILQQKEGFSPYVFEDIALNLLAKKPDLKAKFEHEKETDKAFAGNWYAQLNWIYKHSDYAEKAYMNYPVYRIMQ
ncbi:M14 family metallopeptidase [Zhouia sp. PK063]|uniref:M14 family metallopeptidase n=1 Tax=Zhouia sp. PK063 TaxID=3373602 RepID=UPI003792DC9A